MLFPFPFPSLPPTAWLWYQRLSLTNPPRGLFLPLLLFAWTKPTRLKCARRYSGGRGKLCCASRVGRVRRTSLFARWKVAQHLTKGGSISAKPSPGGSAMPAEPAPAPASPAEQLRSAAERPRALRASLRRHSLPFADSRRTRSADAIGFRGAKMPSEDLGLGCCSAWHCDTWGSLLSK